MKGVNDIAKERCSVLLELAQKRLRAGELPLARRYVTLARKIAMRHRFSLGSNAFCKECSAPLILGISAKRRIDGQKRVLLICLSCGSARTKAVLVKRRSRAP